MIFLNICVLRNFNITGYLFLSISKNWNNCIFKHKTPKEVKHLGITYLCDMCGFTGSSQASLKLHRNKVATFTFKKARFSL